MSLDPTRIPPAGSRFFGAESPFDRTLVEAGAKVHSDSEAIAATVNSQMGGGFAGQGSFIGGVAGTANDWARPIYLAAASDPLYSISLTQQSWNKNLSGLKVRIPDGALWAKGGDGHLGIVDVAAGYEYDFWQVTKIDPVARRITASTAGRLPLGGSGVGDLSRTDITQRSGGACAGGYALSQGQIRVHELLEGHIPHALFMVVPYVKGRVPPAVGDARPGTGEHLPANGQRFALDMSLTEIAALSVPRWKKTILEAMATYGLFIGDTGGGFFKVESTAPWLAAGLPDPLVEFAKANGISSPASGTWKGTYAFRMGGAVDWVSRLRALI